MTGASNVLDNVTVSNTGSASAIDITGALTLIGVTAITTNADSNSGETVESTGTLTLPGHLLDYERQARQPWHRQDRRSTGAKLDNVNVSGGGTIDVDGAGGGGPPPAPATLILSDGATINSGKIEIGPVGTLDVSTGLATLTGVTVDVTSGGVLKVDGAATLDLSGTNITGSSQLNNAGTLKNILGNDTISGNVDNTGGTIEVQSGSLDLSGTLTGVGTLKIDAGTTLEIGSSDTAQTATFEGGTGTLQLDNSFTGTINGQSSTAGSFTVTGAGNITTTSGDALDFTSSGGAVGTPANVTVTPTGTLNGAANGIKVVQNGTGDITVSPSGSVTGSAGYGILAEDSAIGSGNITVDAAGKVTGNGANSVGILAENLNSANNGSITVTASAGAAGAVFGIEALTQGSGGVTVTSTDGATGTGSGSVGILAENLMSGATGDIDVTSSGGVSGVTYGIEIINDGNGDTTLESNDAVSSTATSGTGNYGIRVVSAGSGSETVTTDDNSDVTAGGTGINVVNIASSIAQGTSSITVTNNGTIHSGTQNNIDGSPAGGIYAGYRGVGAPSPAVPDANVFGTVIVNNNGNITADAGYGIDAYNWGIGDVTVNEGKNTTIHAGAIGIGAYVDGQGAGDATVNLADNVQITTTSSYGIQAYSDGSGSLAVNMAQSGTDSITSGSDGIVATNGATAIAAGTPGSTITVNAYGTISSGALNGGATIAGILAGYAGNGLGNPTPPSPTPNLNVNGTVTVNNYASITAATGYGIDAFNWGNGNVTVNDEDGTTISAKAGGSGSSVAGIGAFQLGAAGATGDVTVNLFGDAKVTNTIGIGVNASNNGSGAVTINTSKDSQVSGGTFGIVANASGGTLAIDNEGTVSGGQGLFAGTTGSNNVFVTNDGSITGTSSLGIGVQQGSGTGSSTITNTGTVTGGTSAIGIGESAAATATITNTGTIGAAGASVHAINESGGHLIINNDTLTVGQTVTHGVIDGTINAASTTFNNEAGATWNAVGASTFGASSTIDNAGTISLAGASISDANGLTITNETGGVIDGVSGTNLISGATINNYGTIEATGGTLTIDPVTQLTLTNTGTLEAVTGGKLSLSNIAVTNTQNGHDGTVSTDGGTSEIDLSFSSISGGAVDNAGKLVSTGGTGNFISAAITNDGTIEVKTGALTLSGSISGNGSATIDNGATLELNLADGQNVTFNGTGAELIIDGTAAHGQTAQSFTGDIHGLAATDEIDLRGIAYGNPTYATYTYDATTGLLHVYDGNGDHYDLDIGLGFAGAHFAGSDDTHGGTLITMNAADDAPAFAQTTLTASFSEQSNQTDVGTPDPVAPQTASGTLNFTDVDLTDLPTVSIVSGGQNVTWTSATGVDLSSSLSAPQKAALEQALSLTAESGNHNNGAVDWNYSIADSTLDFLSQGETLTITTTVALDDHQNLATLPTKVITVTIQGADDAPTITAATSDQITEAPGTGNTTTDHAGGTIGFADVDLSDRPVVTAPFSGYTYTDANGDALTLTAGQQSDLEAALTITPDANNANNGSATWSYGVVDGKLDFLAQGETLTLTYTATVTDSQNVTATQPITVTIHGTDDAPTITSATSDQITEAPGTGNTTTDHAGGTISFADVDLSDRPVVTAPFSGYTYTDANGDALTLTAGQQSGP